jgi:hypothetical protein
VRSIEDISDTGAAWVTDVELAMLCAFAKRAERAEAEVERLRARLDEAKRIHSQDYTDMVRQNAEVKRLREEKPSESIRALVEAGDRLADDEDPIDPALEAWAEAKRKAGL